MKLESEEPEPAVQVGAISLVAVARTTIEGAQGPFGITLHATKVPVRVVVDTGQERFALDLEGDRHPIDPASMRRAGA